LAGRSKGEGQGRKGWVILLQGFFFCNLLSYIIYLWFSFFFPVLPLPYLARPFPRGEVWARRERERGMKKREQKLLYDKRDVF
jgi:hypothetical protein